MPAQSFPKLRLDEKELEEIFARTYGACQKREKSPSQKTVRRASFDSDKPKQAKRSRRRKKNIFL